MKLLCLDLGRKTGIAVGEAGVIPPRIWTEILARKGEGYEAACERLGPVLRDWLRLENPDMIVIEHWLHPIAHPDANAVIMQFHLHGVVRGIAGCRSIPIRMPQPAEIRSHFCGKAFAMPRSRGPRTAAQKAEARKATKAMVINRAVLLGYLPRGSDADDSADAAAMFDWASVHVCRTSPAELHFFGEN